MSIKKRVFSSYLGVLIFLLFALFEFSNLVLFKETSQDFSIQMC